MKRNALKAVSDAGYCARRRISMGDNGQVEVLQ